MNTTPKITNIRSLIEAIETAKEKFSGQVWWRGQRDFEWDLIPSVFRGDNNRMEKSRTLRFRQKAPSRYNNVPSFNDFPNWLFLMQHHSLPTRLLDWSESPLVAIFFASEINSASIDYPRKVKDSDGVLYALSPYKLNQLQLRSRKGKLLMPDSDEAKRIFKCAFEEDVAETDKVIAIRPAEVHPRLTMQLSGFSLHGNGKLLNELPNSEDFLMRFRIPQKSKNGLREELKHLGIRLSNIFPDLDNLARDIKSSIFDDDNEVAELSYANFPPSLPNINYGQISEESST